MKTALVAAPLGQRMHDYLATDIDEGLATGRFRSPCPQATADLVLGFGLLGLRSGLRGAARPGPAEQVAQMVLKALAVEDAPDVVRRPLDVEAIASRARPASRQLGMHGSSASVGA